MATVLDRDAGFCSGEEEEDLDTDMHSPTDASEDSIDVKVKPISSLMGGCKSKRKCAEPRKFGEDIQRRVVVFHNESESECSPFRPWSQESPVGYVPRKYTVSAGNLEESRNQESPSGYVPRGYHIPTGDHEDLRNHESPSGYVPRGYLVPTGDQDEPLSLVLRDKQASSSHSLLERLSPSVSPVSHATARPRPQEVVRLGDCVSVKHEELEGQYIGRVQEVEDSSDRPRGFSVESLIQDRPGPSSSTPSTSIAGDTRRAMSIQSQQRNYKNMTRERRIEANARERTRVHTISAAFDTLRRAVPAYSHNQKLSKLSVLRIACSYILTLSRVAGNDYSADGSQPPLSDCVDNVSRTIQMEGKLRKKKDD